jgi:hypothetical protein
MDVSVDAVLDLQPPPRTPQATRSDAPRSDLEKPFAEYLDTAPEEAATSSQAQAETRTPKKTPGESVEDSSASAAVIPVAPQPPAQPWVLAMAHGATAAISAETAGPAPSEIKPAPVPTAPAHGAIPAPQAAKPFGTPKSAPQLAQDNVAGAVTTQNNATAPPDAPATAPVQQQQTQPTIPAPIALQQNVAANVATQAQAKPHEAKIEAPTLRAAKGTQPEANKTEKPQAQPAPAAFRAALGAVQAASETIKQATTTAERIDSGSAAQQAPAQISSAVTQPTPNLEHVSSSHAQARAVPAAAQVAREIVRRFDGDTTQFELRLDPPELGRVDVRLEVSRDHRVTAIVSADNPQALADLARHARDLEQMLQSAGLQLSDNGLAFDLRQGGERSQEMRDGSGGGVLNDGEADGVSAETPLLARPIGYERWRGVRVDISV